VYITQ